MIIIHSSKDSNILGPKCHYKVASAKVVLTLPFLAASKPS